MEDNQEKIKKHYEEHKEQTLGRRDLLATINIRNMNNFIKTILIKEKVKEESKILDIGCGRGGDLKKFQKRNILEYHGIDISENSIEDAIRRYKNSNYRFRAKFDVGDAYNKKIDLKQEFDAVSIQFSFHYAFSSLKTLQTALTNITNHLKTGGLLIATIPNSDALLRRYRKYGNFHGNKFHEIEFIDSYEEILKKENKFGIEYKFTLADSVIDCVEYLIDMEVFEKECEEFGLKIVEYTEFLEYFNKNYKKYKEIYNLMVNKKLDIEELRVIELYSILVIEKK